METLATINDPRNAGHSLALKRTTGGAHEIWATGNGDTWRVNSAHPRFACAVLDLVQQAVCDEYMDDRAGD